MYNHPCYAVQPCFLLNGHRACLALGTQMNVTDWVASWSWRSCYTVGFSKARHGIIQSSLPQALKVMNYKSNTSTWRRQAVWSTSDKKWYYFTERKLDIDSTFEWQMLELYQPHTVLCDWASSFRCNEIRSDILILVVISFSAITWRSCPLAGL